MNKAFESSTPNNLAKGYRKICFCFLQVGQNKKAIEYLNQIPARCGPSATTLHLEFIANLRIGTLGSEKAAVAALTNLVQATDFQGSMLLNVSFKLILHLPTF